ncbi:DNA cytosine methyltransferase [Microvirga sp. BT688]|uniref:DNA cytosine methyltransferase n=1 Tax=Microvirga sp. TaxID=1873136 RepID=UPI001682D9A6|nr:DNA cytosine methyltransferase [Microvirga sp.]MBD2746628.1 DNA cytosine methyltransferase [Microvirga sp.]
MNAVEVCCGAGGMSLGLRKAGFKIGLAIDFWSEAVKIYRQNIKTPSLLARPGRHAVQGDLANLLAVVPEALTKSCDIIVGSPPCQDFSAAGSRIEGSRADVTLAFAIFVAALRPRWLLMENVPEAKKSKAYQRARKILKRAGYGLTEQIVDASFYGVAQARRRFIVIGRLDEADGFLDSALVESRSDKPMSVRALLGDDVGVHPGDSKSPPETRVYYMRPFSLQPGVRSIDLPCPTIITTSHEPASSRYIKHAKDLARGQDVPPLSVDELSLIQGFPKTWDWSGLTKKNKAQMIANAVPVKLAEALGRIIKARDEGHSIPAIETDFVTWLTKARKAKGQVLRNRKTYLNRGRKLLNGRMLADIDLELALLEKNKEFAGLSASVKSDIRLSLRLHAEWRDLPRQKRMRDLAKEMTEAYENDDPQEEHAPIAKLRIGSRKAA